MKLAVGLALFSAALAQEPTIRTNVPLVVASVAVTDKSGRPIEGLTASDFVVLDDGRTRTAQVDISDSEAPPLALVIAIQSSGFAEPALEKIRKTASLISESVLGANGEAAVLAFGDDVKLIQDFTRDHDRVADAIDSFKAKGGDAGRMIDAVNRSIELLGARGGARRPCILLISESRDRGSKHKLAEVLSKLQRAGVLIYCVTYSATWTAFTTKPAPPPDIGEGFPGTGGLPGTGSQNAIGIPGLIFELARAMSQNTAEAFASATGGRRLSFETVSKLERDLSAVADDVHTRYLLSFTPDATPAPSFHRLEIRIKNRPDAIVKARPGYWTEAGSQNLR